MNRRFLPNLIWFLLPSTVATAQLAITEVMSSSSTNYGAQVAVGGPDFWELTNFGTNVINLTGYKFNDNLSGIYQADPTPFENLVIRGGESIVFFESKANAIPVDSFRAWWGLTSTVKIVAYTNDGYGFSADPPGDGVRLWGPTAVNEDDLVDSVDFGSATRGQTFTYDPISGAFGVLSTGNMLNVFKAATADDIGSPGKTTGRVPISFAQAPVALTVNPGDTATFTARHRGMPRPTYQWLKNGLLIPGAITPSYTIESVQGNHAGQYQVRLSNVFEVITSTAASLTLNTNGMPPRFTAARPELWVFVDQDAVFQSIATGLPQPTYRWWRNGIEISGATDRTLIDSGPHSVGTNRYTVVASNIFGSATNETELVVSERPNLRITEIMPSEFSFIPKHEDWWELTNFGTNTVDIYGYRFDDYTELDGSRTQPRLPFAWTNTNHIFIRPGESIVFVESISADAFRRWWGWSNLLANLQIITYSGGGFGFSQVKGDGVALWNMGATSEADLVNGKYTKAQYSHLDLVPGHSLTTDSDSIFFETCCYLSSEPGVNGAFVADEGGDVGSPGYIRTPTEPRLLSISMTANGCRLTWRSILPGNYVIQYRDRLDGGAWQVLTSVSSAEPMSSYVDTNIVGNKQRFYRVAMAP